jgi:hypothetical protein
MYKTHKDDDIAKIIKENAPNKFITVDAPTLASMLNCGRATATKIGNEAGARVQIGRRVLYRVSKVEQYLDTIQG